MPHDVSGNLLQAGDEIIIRAKVKSVQTGEEYCNVTAESLFGRKPDGSKETFSLNAAVVERVPATPEG